jgi:hypothetical protein
MPNREGKLPGTLQRSPPKAQRTYRKVMDNAEREYGSGERAGRVAYAALKHGFEKVGDHWEPKKKPGPSDPRSQQATTEAKRQGKGETFGGVDALGNSRDALYERAKALRIPGRSSMNKEQLARAIGKKGG